MEEKNQEKAADKVIKLRRTAASNSGLAQKKKAEKKIESL